MCRSQQTWEQKWAASFLLDSLEKLLPDWLVDPLLEPDVDDSRAEERSGAFGSSSLFMPRAIVIPGALHICSNLCKDVSGKLSHWAPFLKQLGLFEALLCNRDRRERFVATCVPADAADSSLFKNFSGSLYEKRWGAVVSFLRKLLPLLSPLQKYWSHEKFSQSYQQRGRAADNDQGDEGGGSFVAPELTSALQSAMFHVYATLVLSLFNVVEDLASWFEGCLCHEHQLKQPKNKTARVAHKEIREFGPYAFCPMKGKRAPELAAGCLGEVFDKLLSMRKVSLLKTMRGQLSQEDERIVMQDLESGRNYIQLGLQVKFNFWGKLPWRRAALCHVDTGLAREAAADMLQQTLGLDVPDPSLVHHPITLQFLSPGGVLRPMVQAFADGEPMNRLLQSEVSKLAFMPVVERSIEAQHSLISRRVQKNWRSGRIVSLTLRVPDIKTEIDREASFLKTLTEAFASTRDPMQAARQLGIQEHPALVDACFQPFHHARVTGIVNKIVYRCDLESKFEGHTEARNAHDKETGKRARLADQTMKQLVAPASASGAPPRARQAPAQVRQAMLRAALEDHF